MNSPQVSDHFAPGQEIIDIKEHFFRFPVTALSHVRLSAIVQAYQLYPSKLDHLPVSDLVDELKANLTISSTESHAIHASFTYSDPKIASKVLNEICTAIINESVRFMSERSASTFSFLSDMARRTASDWLNLEKQIRATANPDPRMLLDRDLLRKQYIDLTTKLAEFSVLIALQERKFSSSVELLDPPTIPENPEPPREAVVAGGTVAGLIIGVLVHLALRFRRKRLPVPDPVS